MLSSTPLDELKRFVAIEHHGDFKIYCVCVCLGVVFSIYLVSKKDNLIMPELWLFSNLRQRPAAFAVARPT